MITEETLWSYIDGTLSAQERNAVTQAIANDVSVNEQYKYIIAMHRLLQMQSAETPGATFAASVMTSVSKLPAYTRPAAISLYPVAAFALPLLGIALVACILLSGTGILQPFSLHISPVMWGNLKFYSLLLDAVMFFLFLETWYYRFTDRAV